MHKESTQVLVVGAGPVGMLTALLLKQAGIRVRIIDQEQQTTTHSYACALHPGTLRLFNGWGVADDILAAAHQVNIIALYDNNEWRAQASLRELKSDFRCVVVLPQNRFEEIVERRFSDAKLKVEWGHRLASISQDEDKVVAQIDRLRESAKGYVVPYLDLEVVKRFDIEADFVIGADGHHSHVRECLGIGLTSVGPPRTFDIYEFETDRPLAFEMRLVLHDGASVLWPLPGNRCRWTFELGEDEPEPFPTKERSPFIIEQAEQDQERRERIERFVQERARWFRGKITEIYWAPRVQFASAMAERFGSGRCWLIGDAAHQTSPIGVQSMNIGLHEAADLAGRLIKVLHGDASLQTLEEFGHERHNEWHQLLTGETIHVRPEADPWIRARASALLSCLPASGDDLVGLLNQMQIDFHPRPEVHPV